MTRIDASRFDAVLLAGTPLIDVRAPREFAHGAIPGAVNMPILDDEERHRVGICYKHSGQQAAIALGHKLVSGAVRERRIARWCEFVDRHPDALVYCWRGGLRSALAAEWLRDAGRRVPVVSGGYKALRARLLRVFDDVASGLHLYLVGGRTGSNKTGLVRALARGVDLEGHARHRGSSFGRGPVEPPQQIEFENALALELMRVGNTGGAAQPVFLEDESRQIGAVSIPLELYRAMKKSPVLVVETPRNERVRQILFDYILGDLEAYRRIDAENGFATFAYRLRASLQRISRRLGDERYRRASAMLDSALGEQQRCGVADGHAQWIELLLREYYDPMYDYQLSRSADRIGFRGNYDEVLARCIQLSSTRSAGRA